MMEKVWRRVKDRRLGQSTLEYALVLTAIILAVAVAANGPIKTAVGKMFEDISKRITQSSAKLVQQ